MALLFCSYSPSSTPQRPHYFHPHSFAAFLWLFMAFSAITYSPNTVALNLAVFESWIVQMVTLSYWVDKKNIKSTHALSNKSSILNAKENRFSPGKMVSWLSTASIFHFPTEKWPRTAKTVQNQCRKWRQPAIIVIFQLVAFWPSVMIPNLWNMILTDQKLHKNRSMITQRIWHRPNTEFVYIFLTVSKNKWNCVYIQLKIDRILLCFDEISFRL